MNRQLAIYLAVGLIGVAAPLVTTGFYAQFALLWIMVTLALCWDVMGGQMGYIHQGEGEQSGKDGHGACFHTDISRRVGR